ncbi:MAG: PrsW family intramembrane metalloprotease [Spirochaetia bacterium]|nr:PrsW family intramembrane metalloprotease [Spirochaetia bacterium]
MSELDSLWLKITLAIVPVPAVYLLYFRSFLRKLQYVEHAEAFLWGLALAGGLLFLTPFTDFLSFRHYVLQGFFRAGLIEKAGAYLLILFLTKRRGVHVVVWESVISAMLLGLGFSAAENIVYAFGSGTAVIVARFFSAVPLHVATCGMIGYFVAKAVSSWSLNHRITLYGLGAVIPWLLHGSFDAALLSGSTPAFLIGPILVGTVMTLEYMLARAQTLPPLEVLDELGFHAEDWETILRESQYERWILRSMGSANTEYVPFLGWHLTRARAVAVGGLIVFGLAALIGKEPILALLGLRLGEFESITLFTILPITYAAALVSIGAVNPSYFRNSMIKIPIIADVTYKWPGNEGGATITYDITSANCFIQSVESLPQRNSH